MGANRMTERGRFPQRKRGAEGTSADYEEIKKRLHKELLDSLDFDEVSRTAKDELYASMRSSLMERVEQRNVPPNRIERERLIQEILDNILGYGPIEVLIRDPEVSDILINGHTNIYVDRRGKMIKTNIEFESNKHLMQIIERIVVAVGRRVDEQNPMVDARMIDGSRFNAIIRPCALDGCAASAA